MGGRSVHTGTRVRGPVPACAHLRTPPASKSPADCRNAVDTAILHFRSSVDAARAKDRVRRSQQVYQRRRDARLTRREQAARRPQWAASGAVTLTCPAHHRHNRQKRAVRRQHEPTGRPGPGHRPQATPDQHRRLGACRAVAALVSPGHSGPAAQVPSCLTRAGHRRVAWPHEIPDSGISHRSTGSGSRSGTEAGDISPVFAALEHAAGDFTTLGKNPSLEGSSPSSTRTSKPGSSSPTPAPIVQLPQPPSAAMMPDRAGPGRTARLTPRTPSRPRTPRSAASETRSASSWAASATSKSTSPPTPSRESARRTGRSACRTARSPPAISSSLSGSRPPATTTASPAPASPASKPTSPNPSSPANVPPRSRPDQR